MFKPFPNFSSLYSHLSGYSRGQTFVFFLPIYMATIHSMLWEGMEIDSVGHKIWVSLVYWETPCCVFLQAVPLKPPSSPTSSHLPPDHLHQVWSIVHGQYIDRQTNEYYIYRCNLMIKETSHTLYQTFYLYTMEVKGRQ